MGRESLRRLLGGVESRTRYDRSGRVTDQVTKGVGYEVSHRSYEWDLSGKLRRLTAGSYTAEFDYDLVGKLAAARYDETEILYKLPDRIGNIYPDRLGKAASYERGGRLKEETGLAYNRFRYYSPEIGAYISQDPIRLEAGLTNLYAYVYDVNSWVDPSGLDAYGVNQDVYALYKKTDVINGIPVEGAKPYYIGISQNADIRLGQHTSSGRFNPQTDVKVDLHKDIDYAKARAYEQHYIEEYGTIDQTNPKANQQKSFRHSRTDKRGLAFEEEYQKLQPPTH